MGMRGAPTPRAIWGTEEMLSRHLVPGGPQAGGDCKVMCPQVSLEFGLGLVPVGTPDPNILPLISEPSWSLIVGRGLIRLCWPG